MIIEYEKKEPTLVKWSDLAIGDVFENEFGVFMRVCVQHSTFKFAILNIPSGNVTFHEDDGEGSVGELVKVKLIVQSP